MHSSYYTAGSFDVYAVNYIFKSFKKSKLKMMDEYLLAKKIQMLWRIQPSL